MKKMHRIDNVTIGTDPEFFLKSKEGNFKSAIGLIPGSKTKPHILPNGAGLQTDNVAIEFASVAAQEVEAFVDHLKQTFLEMRELLPEGYELSVTPSADFDESELDNKQAKEFGCSPDYDVWTMTMNEKPTPENIQLRSCGGHIHVGHETITDLLGKTTLVKMMDCFHGLVSTVLDTSYNALVRRDLYGKAGCHRPTTYGVEYRTLSNYWLKHPKLVELQHSMVHDCLNIMECDLADELIATMDGDVVVKAINTGDDTMAKKLIDAHVILHMSDRSRDLFFECAHLDPESEELDAGWNYA